MRILVAEDEPDMLKIIKMYLEKDGYQVVATCDGKQALDILYQQDFDLLICDWMMPVMDGVTLCKEIRSSSMPIKVIMLTAKSQTKDEILGLKWGADDYIKKPFEPELLLIRIKKMFGTEREMHCGNISLNPDKHTVTVSGNEVKLTIKEWQLLDFFMMNKGVTLSRDKLIERVWGIEYDGDERTLDTHIRRLRNKIGVDYIKTFVGVGYRMDETHE